MYGGGTCPKMISPTFTCYFHPNWKEEQEESKSADGDVLPGEPGYEQKPGLGEMLKRAREDKAGRPEPSLGELFASIRENSRTKC